MASNELTKLTVNIRLSPDNETMEVILAMLNMWQDAHPDLMVAMVLEKDRYKYEIIKREKAV